MTTKLAPAYLIVGDDAYLVDEALEQIIGESADFSIDEFGPDDGVPAITQALMTPSMFGSTRIVVVRRAEEMGAPALREIAAYLEDPSPSACLVLASGKPLPQIVQAVKKIGRVVDAGRGRRADIVTWLAGEAKERGAKMSGEACAALVEAMGEERMALSLALEELLLAHGPNARLGPAEVRAQFRDRSDARVFGFVDAVAARNRGTALVELGKLLSQGEAPQAIFWTLARHFRMLIAAGHASPSQLAESLRLPQWRAEKLARQSRNFNQRELIQAYCTLAESDRKMKSSEEPEELTLERAVVAITGR